MIRLFNALKNAADPGYPGSDNDRAGDVDGGAADSQALKARGLFRFAFFAPIVVGEVAYAAVFRLMFTDDFGVVNKLLETVGIGGISWFTSPTAAMAVIIMAVTWRWAGYNAIIILAGLQSVPEDVYEAATLERISR